MDFTWRQIMKNLLLLIMLIISFGSLANDAIPQNAIKMFDAFAENKPCDLSDIATPDMAEIFTNNKFISTRKAIIAQYGKFVRWESEPLVKSITDGKTEYLQVFRNAEFEKGKLTLVCPVIAKTGKIAGFFIKPFIPLPKVRNNDYEQELSFGAEWKLTGTLTLPDNYSNQPIVILIHGSGACDRNETIGPNQPFSDIAKGLRERGIACYRYDKRTLIYAQKMANMQISLNDEVIDDAVEAIKMIHVKYPKSPIYVLGHSLGAMALPKVATRTAIPAGYIFVAALARPLDTVIGEQLEYIIGLMEDTEENKQEILESMLGAMNNAMSQEYYDEVNSGFQLELVKQITQPMLFLQGGRDYQVTIVDFNLWKDSLKGKNNSEFKFYDNLNHLMQEGKGKATPDEYYEIKKFSPTVIHDIVEFIKKPQAE